MKDFDPRLSFGPGSAARYDEHPRGDEQVAAAFLAALATGGRALEFAIGTGRIALPLAALGVAVDGSSCRRQWSISYDVDLAAITSGSRSAT